MIQKKKIKVVGLITLIIMIVGNVTGCGLEKVADFFGTSVEKADANSANIPDSTENINNTDNTNSSEKAWDSNVAEPETETEPEQLVQTITISATGDCTLGKTQQHDYYGSFYSYYDNYGEDYFFSGVNDIFEKDTFTLVNLECVLTTSTDRVEKTYNLKGEPEYAGILTAGAIEGCSLGNNHTYDYGESSHTDTENALEEEGIMYAFQDHIGTYTTEDGLVIGVVSANLLSMSRTYEDYLYNGISSLEEQGADVIIASCHWGIEREYYPNDVQKQLAHVAIDNGADLVIGEHPHVLQGIETYNGKKIVYSLGNFCFGGNKNPSDKDTMIFQQTFTLRDGEIQGYDDFKIIPCRLSSVTNVNDYQPTILEGAEAEKVMNKINEISAGLSE